jgi:hypothetical protein
MAAKLDISVPIVGIWFLKKIHKELKHKGTIYTFNQCDFQKRQFPYHQQNKHEGTSQVLVSDKKPSHFENTQRIYSQGIRYSCNYCDYQAATKYMKE